MRALASDHVAAYFGESATSGPITLAVNRATALSGRDVALLPATRTATITGRVVNGALATPMSVAYVWFYKQNEDGTWSATSPGWGLPTKTVFADSTGACSSGDLPIGNYKVAFFTIHTGRQWWAYVATVDLATVVVLDTPGMTAGGSEGWFNKPF